MCRALLYLGQPVLLDTLLFQPDSALIRQSYMPKMLHMLNLAGFGLRAWDPQSHDPAKPYAYGSPSLPVFDRNLKNLAEKVRAACVLGHVRGVAYSTTVDISLQNVHPFQFEGLPWCLAHNGSTDSEWIYALFVSRLADPSKPGSEKSVFEAIEQTLGIIRGAREKLGIDVSSSVNLFIANGSQLAAVRYCFDFGRYRTEDPSKLHEANLGFLSLWYTLGRDYALHDGEWRMTGGAENADSVIVTSEPLTRDTSSWVELPEYGALFAEVRRGRPHIAVRLLD
jgi:predicted glutamine amidotransferase